MARELDAVQARNAQRAASKRATFEQLASKKRREKEISFVLPGTDEEVSLLFRSIGAKEYDKLIADYPPNTEQKAQGESYDANRFAPALISRTLMDPELSEDQCIELWSSPDWSRGEVMTLYMAALEVCSTGFNVPINVDD